MSCITVRLYVSPKSQLVVEQLRKAKLPRHHLIVEVIAGRDHLFPALPAVVVTSNSTTQIFYGFDLQRIEQMLLHATRQTSQTGLWRVIQSDVRPAGPRKVHHRRCA